MISVRKLASASRVFPDDFAHWRRHLEAGSGFTRLTIPGKGRRPRHVLRPTVGLDRVLKQLVGGLASVSGYSPPPQVHGFVKGRDIATNAAHHLDKDVVLRVDLLAFFSTIDERRLVQALLDFGFDNEATAAVAGVTLVEGVLAQGFSTSPWLSNLVFFHTDIELANFASEVGVSYTRYVDDLVFSGSQRQVNDQLLEAITALLTTKDWTINRQKTRFMRRGKPQYVTGLYVGDAAGPHIPRPMKRLLRREVYFASKFGLDNAQERSPTPIDAGRLNGWVHYAAHVDPVFGAKLLSSWQHVATKRSTQQTPDWDQVLDEIDFPADW